MLVKAGGPKWSGTKAEATRFHDDKDAYTGVHAQGGPSTVDKGKDLSDLADRSEATVRGTKKTPTQTSKSPAQMSKSPTQMSKDKTPAQSPSKPSVKESEDPSEDLDELMKQADVSFTELNQEPTSSIEQTEEEEKSMSPFASPELSPKKEN